MLHINLEIFGQNCHNFAIAFFFSKLVLYLQLRVVYSLCSYLLMSKEEIIPEIFVIVESAYMRYFVTPIQFFFFLISFAGMWSLLKFAQKLWGKIRRNYAGHLLKPLFDLMKLMNCFVQSISSFEYLNYSKRKLTLVSFHIVSELRKMFFKIKYIQHLWIHSFDTAMEFIHTYVRITMNKAIKMNFKYNKSVSPTNCEVALLQ